MGRSRTQSIRRVHNASVLVITAIAAIAAHLWFTASPIVSRSSDWQPRAAIPTARSEITATAWEQKIYVLGGIGLVTRATFEAYDSTTNQWETLPNLPERRHHVATAAYEGAIYAAGGFSNLAFKPSASSWRYDIAEARWTAIADLPAPRGEHALTTVGNFIYLLAGSGPDSQTVWRYSPDEDQWQSYGQHMPTARDSAAVVANAPYVYVMGGRQRGISGNLATVERFDTRDGSWKTLTSMPQPRAGQAAAIVGETLCVFGGEDLATATVFSEVYRYNTSDNKWSLSGSLPVARHGLAGAAVGSTLYAISGANRAGLRTPFALSQAVTALDTTPAKRR